VTYSISGTVAPGGLAKEGARVSLSGAKSASALTDSRGGFLFQGLAPGEYMLSLEGSREVRRVTLTDHSLGGVEFESGISRINSRISRKKNFNDLQIACCLP